MRGHLPCASMVSWCMRYALHVDGFHAEPRFHRPQIPHPLPSESCPLQRGVSFFVVALATDRKLSLLSSRYRSEKMPVRARVAAGYRTPGVQEMRSSRVFQEYHRVSRDPTYNGPIQKTIARSSKRAKPLPLTAVCPTSAVAGGEITIRVTATEISQTLGAVLLPVETDLSLVTWTNVGPLRPLRGRQFISTALQLRLRQSTIMTVGELRKFNVPCDETVYTDVFGSFHQRDESWRRDPSLVAFEVTAAAAATGVEGAGAEKFEPPDSTATRAVEMIATVTKAGNHNVYVYVEDADGYTASCCPVGHWRCP